MKKTETNLGWKEHIFSEESISERARRYSGWDAVYVVGINVPTFLYVNGKVGVIRLAATVAGIKGVSILEDGTIFYCSVFKD